MIEINKHDELDTVSVPCKVDFGDFGIKDSKQFVYPSLVRLGQEANSLIHLATNSADEVESLSKHIRALSVISGIGARTKKNGDIWY